MDSSKHTKSGDEIHFCCKDCDAALITKKYILKDDKPFCTQCYEKRFSKPCFKCSNRIGIDCRDLSYQERHWHEYCFVCCTCKCSLVDKPFGAKDDSIYCAQCYEEAFAMRCAGCDQIFKGGQKKLEFKGGNWHDHCFRCVNCSQAIGTNSFVPKDNDVYCTTCYEEKFATKCAKCTKKIVGEGVSFKGKPWHRDCFRCSGCESTLAGQRFTVKDEKAYCGKCYGEYFAKRCNSCTKPIIGMTGSKYVSFGGQDYHNDCFNCTKCSATLVGQGFISDGPDLLCSNCSSARHSS